jgi:CHRD domain
MRTRRALAGIIVGSLAVALVAAGSAGAAATRLAATLSGANEVPGPGDADGSGQAQVDVKLKPGKKSGKVCFTIQFQGIDAPFAGHIHDGGPTTDGPIVVGLFENPAGETFPNDCVKAKKRVLKPIAKNPEDFYVNLHNDAFPGGAIRGQLAER